MGYRWRKYEEIHHIHFECTVCGQTDMRIFSMRRWFTLFFLPIFPISRQHLYLECLHCESSYKVNEGTHLEDLYKYASFDGDEQASGQY
jgi:hypothetical protein